MCQQKNCFNEYTILVFSYLANDSVFEAMNDQKGESMKLCQVFENSNSQTETNTYWQGHNRWL